jgi:hypothetical protein
MYQLISWNKSMKSHPYNSSALSSHSNSNFNSISNNSSSYSSNYGNTKADSYSQSITLRTVSNEEVRFEYSHSQQRVLAFLIRGKENENEVKQIKVEDMPIEFSKIKDTSTLALFLDGAYVKASTLSNDEVKLYVEQRGLGGGRGDRDLPSWNKLLNGIREKQHNEAAAQSNNNNNSKVVQKKVFISYAWEDDSTEEGRVENAKLQRYLKNLRNDLQKAGMSVFLDIGDMHGDMKVRMEKNLKASDVIITINTPRFKARAEAVPQTNLGFEYQLTLEKAKDIPYGIIPLHYSGSFNEAFPDSLKAYLIRKNGKDNLIHSAQEEGYCDTLVATQRPLGIIPAIYGIDCDDNLGYRKLVQN